MKTIDSCLRLLLLLVALFFVSDLCAEPGSKVDAPARNESSIPFSELGAKATADYHGDAIGIERTAEGARLHTKFQKLAGTVTKTGLALESTGDGGGRVRLVADALGRVPAPTVEAPRASSGGNHRLPRTGKVIVSGQTISFQRPGLVEEYSVSVDGVRQDFVLAERPAGTGDLRVELALDGARAETTAYGAKLTVKGSGRELAYSRLKVTDAQGKELVARFEVLTPSRLAVRVEDTAAVYPVRIDPTFSDARWSALGSGIGGYAFRVYALALDGAGNLYAGGHFTTVGGVNANHIAKWDGSTWSALGSGFGGSYPIVIDLALDGSGNLYAGGDFDSAGGVSANRIAKWNGSAWSALGSGIPRYVNALALDGSGNLYAGGDFDSAGGVPASNIAKWNGSTWSALGSGLGSASFGRVFALALDDSGNLYAGGDFDSAGGVTANYIAKWNGSAWSALGSGMGGGGPLPYVIVLALDGSGNLYAGGYFTTAGGVSANRIAKWNGSTWSALGSGMNDNVGALALDGSGNLYAGGEFTTAGGVSANRIAKWNGSAWSALGSGIGGLDAEVSALALDGSDNLYAGGGFTTAGTTTVNNIAKARLGSISGDFNGDGKPDYVIFNPGTLQTALWYLNGSAFVSSASGPTLPAGWSIAAVADFNGDGNPDYVLFNGATRRTAIWYLDGAVNTGGAAGPTLPPGWSIVAAADFNGDRQPDLVLFNSSTLRTAIWYMNGTTVVSAAHGPTLPAGWAIRGVADFNRDGQPDFALFNSSTLRTGIWYLNGAVHASGDRGPTLRAGWVLQGVADFNGDDQPDFLLFNSSTRRTAIWYLNGATHTGGDPGPTLPSDFDLAAP